MNLADFAQLICALPVQFQAFRSKRETWSRFDRNTAVAQAINQIFGKSNEVLISRADLHEYAQAEDLVPFVMATIIWGYPRGMRGNHVQNLALRMPELVAHLRQAKANGIDDWDAHYSAMDIEGVGLSTYTKFLHFLRVQVGGLTALILDERLINVAKRQIFAQLEPLGCLRVQNADARYLSYLRHMYEVAKELNVEPAALELFLFMFGSNLKPPAAQPGTAWDAPQAALT